MTLHVKNRIFASAMICIAVIVILKISYSIYSYMFGGFRSSHEKHFHVAIDNALQKKLDVIAIRTLTDFEWQKVCYAVPYDTQKDVEKKTGLSIPDYDDKVTWADHEGFWTLLFIRSENQIVPIRVPRVTMGSYPRKEDKSLRCVKRNEAILRVIALNEDNCRKCVKRIFVLEK